MPQAIAVEGLQRTVPYSYTYSKIGRIVEQNSTPWVKQPVEVHPKVTESPSSKYYNDFLSVLITNKLSKTSDRKIHNR